MISALGTAFKYQLFILEVVYLEVENYYLGDKADLLYSAVGTEAPLSLLYSLFQLFLFPELIKAV